MRQLPKFNQHLAKFVHSQVKKETDNACKKLADGGTRCFKRQDVDNFSYNEIYSKLCMEAPIMMSSLLGASSKMKFHHLQVEYRIFLSTLALVFTKINMEMHLEIIWRWKLSGNAPEPLPMRLRWTQ